MPDKFENTAIGVVITVVIIILGLFVLFAWGFIQFIQWLTSK